MTPSARLSLAHACSRSRQARADELRLCASDPAAWAHRWVWTYDPRVTPSWLPMSLWARQAEYLRWLCLRLRQPGPAVVVKPRDVGASWLGAAFGVWSLLFLEGASIGYSSRKLMYVESGSPDSTFGKVRSILSYLPTWMRPEIHQVRTPAPLIRSLDTGTELKGEGGDNVGRGGRCTIYMLDEYAYMERQQDIESAVSEAAGSVIYCSTFGAPTDRFRRMSDTLPARDVFRFSWTDDPRRDAAWLERKRATVDETHFRRDVLCDPDASLSGQIFRPEWVDACIGASLPARGDLVAGYDPAGDGSSEAMLCVRRGPCVLRLDVVPGEHDEARARWVAAETGRSTVNFDASGGWGESARRVLSTRGEPIHGGAPVSDGAPDHVELAANVRAGMYLDLRWRARNTWLRAQGEDVDPADCLSLPDDPKLREQLLSLTMVEKAGGRLYVQSKAEMRARGVSSPDRADAVGYAFAGPVVGGGVIRAAGW